MIVKKILKKIKLRTWIALGLIFVLSPIIFAMVYGVFGALGGSNASPVAHWAFDEGVDNTCAGGTNDACDSSGNGNDVAFGASSAAPVWQTEDKCVSGKCLFFQGSEDYIDISGADLASTVTYNGTYTISLWFKTNSTSTTQTLINWANSGSDRNGIILNSSGMLSAKYYDGSYTEIGGPTVTAGTWYHVVFVNNATSLSLYVNGVAYNAASTAQNISTGQRIGHNGSANYFLGSLDEVKVFDTALSESQAKAEFAGGAAVLGQESSDFLSDGLVGYWNMDDDVSGDGQTIADHSGNTKTATTSYGSNATGMDCTVAGKFGKGCEFDGVDDAVNLNSSYSPNANSMTFAAWFMLDSSQSASSDIFAIFGNNQNVPLIGYQPANTRFTGRDDVQISMVNMVTPSNLADSTWHHVAMTINLSNSVISVYLDGNLLNTASYSPTFSANQNLFRFGNGYIDGGTTAWDGILDEMRLYERALSSSEIAQLYNWAPGPVVYFPFDEGSGTTTVYDRSGNGKNGTMNNFEASTAWTEGKFGSAVKFGGTDEWISVANTAAPNFPTRDFTYSFWVRPDGTPGTYYGLIDNSGNEFTVLVTGVNVDIHTNNAYGASFSGGQLVVGEWDHVAISRLGSTVSIYVNGVFNNSFSDGTAFNFTVGGCALLLGVDNQTSCSSSLGNYFNGALDEFRIYNYARTQQQVVEDMNGGHPAGGSPISSQVAYWKLDEQYGSTVNSSTQFTFTESVSGASWRAYNNCKLNGCLEFDGSDDVLTITNTSTIDFDTGLSNGFTFTTWFYADSDGENDVGQIFQKGTNTYCRTDNESGGLVDVECNLDLATTDANINVSSAVTTGSWNHLALAYNDASSITLYINGVQRGTNTGSGATVTDTANLLIGGTTTANFDGRIDEFKIYSSSLSASQVMVDMNAGSANTFSVFSNEKDDISGGAGDPPIGYWNLNENTSTTANDTSGNGNTGTLTNGPTWGAGKYGSAVDFDGDDSYVSTNLEIDETSAYSVTFWTYPRTLADDNTFFNPSGANEGSGLYYDTNTLVYCNSSGCSDQASSSSSPLSLNTWSHVAFTYDGNGTAAIYVNGNNVTSDSSVDEGALNGTPGFLFGNNNASVTNAIDGLMDEVKVFDYALNQAQVSYDYNRGAPIAWYKLDECTGSTANNSGSLASANGTISIGATGSNTSTGTCSSGTGTEAWNNGTNGKFNGSLHFDGTDDLINLSSNVSSRLNVSGQYSISAWFRTESVSGTNTIINFYNSSATTRHGILLTSNFLYSGYYNAPSYTGTVISGITTDTWYHIVTVVNGGAVTTYLNGTAYSGGSISGLGIDNRIGFSSPNGGYFEGQIDDVRVYNYALSSDQVKNVMNNGAAVRFEE